PFTSATYPPSLHDALPISGMATKPAKLVMTCGIAGFASYFIAGFFLPHAYLSIPIALAATFLPIAFVLFKRKRRLRKFEEHFPEDRKSTRLNSSHLGISYA